MGLGSALPLLALTKSQAGSMLTLIGLVAILIVLVSMAIRNHIDELSPRTQAVVFWVLAIVTVAGVAAGVVWMGGRG